jgi:hypothetical protein
MKSVFSIVGSMVLCAGLATPAPAALVLWTPASLMVSAAGAGESYRNPSALPYADSHSIVAATASSSSLYDFTTSSFRNDFQQTMSAPQSGASMQDTIWFSVTETTNYEISGLYAATASGYAGFTRLLVELTVYNGGPTLFSNVQDSYGDASSTFVVGGQGGNSANTLTGSATGTLQMGTLYVLNYVGQRNGGFETNSGTGAGHVQLTTIPEPVSLGLLLCAPALLMRRRTSIRR